jgi:hemerythrin-like metal-binding protein
MIMERRASAAAQPACGRPLSARAAPRLARLKWLDILETGSTEVDRLHRELVETGNSLLLLLESRAAWPAIVAEATRLVADCIAHFQVEEAVLERTGFPQRAAHQAAHCHMEQEMRRLIARLERLDGSLQEHRDLAASLGPGLLDFMIRTDLDYRSHLLYRQGR